MKLLYKNLDKLVYTGNGLWRKETKNHKGRHYYLYCNVCKYCGEPYLTRKDQPSDFCCWSCSRSGKNHPFYKIGPFYGKHHPEKTKRGFPVSQKGEKGLGWKGGVKEKEIALYDTYAHQISYVEEVRFVYEDNLKILQVKCAYCGKWYVPKQYCVLNRIRALKGEVVGERRFYCSEGCKQACPIYWQSKYPKGFKHTTSREVDPNLRQMVLERDNWTCQICGKTVDEAEIHCHHMDPAAQNPMFQNDMDSCIALCKGCHGWVHTQYGCRYVDLRRCNE